MVPAVTHQTNFAPVASKTASSSVPRVFQPKKLKTPVRDKRLSTGKLSPQSQELVSVDKTPSEDEDAQKRPGVLCILNFV